MLRHRFAGAAQQAAQVAELVPVMNAGDGCNEHPTQTLLDLYTLYERFGSLDHLTGLLAGDCLNSRTIHSLLRGLSLFKNNTVYLLSPQSLRLTRDDFLAFTKRGLKIIEISDIRDIPTDCHFWYWTRLQKERFASRAEYQDNLKAVVVVTPHLLQTYARKDDLLMNPLPRSNQ